MSATEWIASASIDAAPVSSERDELADRDAEVGEERGDDRLRRTLVVDASRPDERSSDDAAPGHRVDVERAVELLVGHQLARASRSRGSTRPVLVDSLMISAAVS